MKIKYLLAYIILGFSTFLGSMCMKPPQPNVNAMSLSKKLNKDSIVSTNSFIDSVNHIKTEEIENYTTKIQNNLQIIQNQKEYLSEIVLSNDSIVNQTLCDSINKISYK